jgi:hypothetical protein
LRTAAGELDVVSASGAALDHPSDAVRAGYNLYEIDDDGRITSIEARVFDRAPDALRRVTLTAW